MREAFDMVWRGRWMILGIAALVTAGTVLYALRMPSPTYPARALLLVDMPGATRAQGGEAPKALDVAYVDGVNPGSRNIANQVLILQQSQLIARRTAEWLAEMEVVPATGMPLSILYDDEGSKRSVEEIALVLQTGHLTAHQAGEETDGIWVEATSTDPEEAALIANRYAEEYVRRSREMSRQRITGSRVFLEGQVERRRQDLQEVEAQIEQQGRRGAVALDAETERVIEQIAALEAALDGARVEESIRTASLLALQQELQEIQPKLVQRTASGIEKKIQLTQEEIARLEHLVEQAHARDPSVAENADAGVEPLSEQIVRLKAHLNDLSEQYVDEAMAARGIDPQENGMAYIAQLNRQIVEEQVAISGLEAKQATLDKRLKDYSARLSSIPEQSRQLAQLHRAQQSTEQLYTRLVDMLQEVRIAEESEIGTARIIRPAGASYEPVQGGRWGVLAMGMCLGLLLGLMAAVARYRLDTRLHTPADVTDLDAEFLGVVPDMRPIIKERYQGKSVVTVQGREVSTRLMPLLAPLSPVSEAYRRLYIGLQFSRPDKVAQTVVVTSPEEGAGKTTTAINLAIAATQANRRVLIVDFDLRRPSIRSQLGLSSGMSLNELLLSDRDKPVDLEGCQTWIEDVYVIGATKPVAKPAKLLEAPQTQLMIDQFKAAFDLIIFDTPPALVATEALFLAARSDVSVVVAAAGSTATDALEQTIRDLRSVGVPFIGTVLNRFNPGRVYGYKYTYQYQYGGYGHYQDQSA